MVSTKIYNLTYRKYNVCMSSLHFPLKNKIALTFNVVVFQYLLVDHYFITTTTKTSLFFIRNTTSHLKN